MRAAIFFGDNGYGIVAKASLGGGAGRGGLRYALGRDQCTSAEVGPVAPADVKVRLGMQNLYASAGHQRNDLEQLAEMAALGLGGAEDGLSKRWVKQAALVDAPGR